MRCSHRKSSIHTSAFTIRPPIRPFNSRLHRMSEVGPISDVDARSREVRITRHSGHGRTWLWLDPGANDPDCVKTFFLPRRTARNRRRSASTRRFEHIFSVSGLVSIWGHAERPERSHDAHDGTNSSGQDCRQERLDADDVYCACEVVGEYVQRHFGRDIGQPLG